MRVLLLSLNTTSFFHAELGDLCPSCKSVCQVAAAPYQTDSLSLKQKEEHTVLSGSHFLPLTFLSYWK